MSQKVAVVTGSNKGIGLAVVEGLARRLGPGGAVYLTARDEGRGRAAQHALGALGVCVLFHQLDVADRASVRRLRDHLLATHGGIDLLVNNAAVANSADMYNSYEETKYIIDINYKSLLTLQDLIFPLVRENGRILNISSDCGHLSNVRNKYWIERLLKPDLTVDDINEFVEWHLDAVKNGTFDRSDFADRGTFAAYRVSKVGVSALTRLQAGRLWPRVAANSLHPGLVRTDMTLGAGFLSAAEAARAPLWLLLDAPHDLRGQYVWYDRSILDWADYTKDYYFKSETLKTMK